MALTSPRSFWLAAVFVLAACGDGELLAPDGGQPDIFGDVLSPDVSPDTLAPDTLAPDTLAPDTQIDGRGEVFDAFARKTDERFLVPAPVAERRWPAAAGSLVAWVESGPGGTALRVWDTAALEVEPRRFAVANLSNPRQLALSDALLVYVDDRYGDPDVFAIDLVSGEEQAVVTTAGAQERPTVRGTRVAWEDCRACVTGEAVAGREVERQVYMRDLALGAEVVVSSAAAGAFAPRFGAAAEGAELLAWVEGRAELAFVEVAGGAVVRHDVSAALEVDQEVAGLELVEGLLAWRPQPLIVNPDSMIVNPDSMWPSDVYLTRLADGETEAATVHAELSGRLAAELHAVGGALSWLEAAPGEPRLGRFLRRDVGAGAAANEVLFEIPDANGLALTPGFAVVTAPRGDNNGQSDLHLFPLD